MWGTEARGYLEEAQGWTDRCREPLEGPAGEPPDLETPAGALWLFMVGAEAARDLETGRLAEAERIYQAIRQALKGSAGEEARSRLAVAYHGLGRVAQERGDLPAAESWCRRSLEINESLGNHPSMASSYHQLGNVALLRRDLTAAEDWYRRSLVIKESLGDRPGMATSYVVLGSLGEARGNLMEALEWGVRCVALLPELPHPSTGPGPRHLARVTGKLGIEALEATWRKVTGEALPDHVRSWVAQRFRE